MTESLAHKDGLEASQTPAEVKTLVQELLRWGYIDSSNKAEQFDGAMRLRESINKVLEPLDLHLRIDEVRGLAIVCVVEDAVPSPDEQWSHPLVRRQRLTLEQSLLVAILRQLYLLQEQEVGAGTKTFRVPVEDLETQIRVYLGDTGSDAKNEQRILTLLDQLKVHGIVSEPDSNEEVTIRPLIVHLANPESLKGLLAEFRRKTIEAGPSS